MVRVLADNWRGVLIQMCYTSWWVAGRELWGLAGPNLRGRAGLHQVQVQGMFVDDLAHRN